MVVVLDLEECDEIYGLMENGMMIDFTLPKTKSAASHRLIVTKPMTHLQIDEESK